MADSVYSDDTAINSRPVDKPRNEVSNPLIWMIPNWFLSHD